MARHEHKPEVGYRRTGSGEEVTIILYNASRFRKRDASKTGAIQEADDPEELERHNVETSIFGTPSERAKHASESLKLAVKFRQFTSEMPKRFRSDAAARSMWGTLFDSSMFTDPQRYLAKLASCFSTSMSGIVLAPECRADGAAAGCSPMPAQYTG